MLTLTEYKQLRLQIAQLAQQQKTATDPATRRQYTNQIVALNKLISAKLHSN